MPSTFTPNKGYELQATGENNGTWGIKLDAVESIVDLNLGGRFNSSGNTGGTVTLSSGQAQNVRHIITGTLTSNLIYQFPNAGGFFLVTNSTTGAFTTTLANAGGGANYVIPQGATALVFVNPDVPDLEVVTTTASSNPGVAANLPTSGGTANAQTVTYSPAVTALTAGQILAFVAGFTNSGPMTFAPNGLAAKNVTKNGTVTLQGSEVTLNGVTVVQYDGTQWQLITDSVLDQEPWVVAGGTVNAIVATYAPPMGALFDGLIVKFRATGANTSTAPTFAPNGLTAHAITRAGGSPLAIGDIPAALAECELRYNLANTRWELTNPAQAFYEYSTLASAATTDLGTVAGPNINVTGTTGITNFGATANAGEFKRIIFAGILTITNNANIKCLGNANITTAAGDTCEGVFTTSGVFTMTDYQRANGQALATPSAAVTAHANGYTVVAGDKGQTLVANSGGAVGWTMIAGSTANGFSFYVRCDVAGTALTLTAAGSDTFASGGVTNLATLVLSPGDAGFLISDGGSPAIWRFFGARHFDSGQQTITSSGSVSLTHGLGVQPSIINWYLHCTSAEASYSIGDEAQVAASVLPATNAGMNALATSSNINIYYGSGANVFQLVTKGGGVPLSLTNTKWTLVARAYVNN